MPKVAIVGLDFQVRQMFMKRGWSVVENDGDADLIVFTGGSDVDPSYYGEAKHPATRSDPSRDAREATVYNREKGGPAFAGICRGGQFLNVMNGGKMWQHVTEHATGRLHPATCLLTDKDVIVTSTHHQMMIPGPDATLLLVADICQSKQGADKQEVGNQSPDVEALFYPATRSLCFQPHPEYVGIAHECQCLFFEYIEKLMEIK